MAPVSTRTLHRSIAIPEHEQGRVLRLIVMPGRGDLASAIHADLRIPGRTFMLLSSVCVFSQVAVVWFQRLTCTAAADQSIHIT